MTYILSVGKLGKIEYFILKILSVCVVCSVLHVIEVFTPNSVDEQAISRNFINGRNRA